MRCSAAPQQGLLLAREGGLRLPDGRRRHGLAVAYRPAADVLELSSNVTVGEALQDEVEGIIRQLATILGTIEQAEDLGGEFLRMIRPAVNARRLPRAGPRRR
jgi:hypothetical protein